MESSTSDELRFGNNSSLPSPSPQTALEARRRVLSRLIALPSSSKDRAPPSMSNSVKTLLSCSSVSF